MPKQLTVNGETHTCAEWGKITGISSKTIYSRMVRGLTPKQIIGIDKLPSDVNRDMRRTCNGCIHWSGLFSADTHGSFCSYILDTGHMRGCKPTECIHYQKKKKGGKK